MSKYLTAIDFGTAKVAVATGEQTDAGIRMISYADATVATGVRGGEINNVYQVMEALKPLIEKTSLQLGEEIDEAVINISGRFLKSSTVKARQERSNPSTFIGRSEVENFTGSMFRQPMEIDDRIFEVSPQRFSVDDVIGITAGEVAGMQGGCMEADFKLFYGKGSMMENRVRVLSNMGITVRKAILSPVASARAVLTEQEMENGAVMVDIGKGTTEVAIVRDNIIRDIAVIPFGGDSITGDIKKITGVTEKWAEAIKQNYGCCLAEYVPENKLLVLRSDDGTTDGEVDMNLLARVIEARVSEIFDAVRYVISRSGYEGRLPAGIVLTGGTSYLPYITELAKSLLDSGKVRLAAPRGSITADSVGNSKDMYSSTAVGLVLEGFKRRLSNVGTMQVKPNGGKKPSGFAGSIFSSLFSNEEDNTAHIDKAEENRKREEERKRQEEEQRRLAEEQRLREKEMARKAEERRQREEEERQRREAEQARKAEERRQREEEEQQRREVEQARKAEERRLREEEEQRRIEREREEERIRREEERIRREEERVRREEEERRREEEQARKAEERRQREEEEQRRKDYERRVKEEAKLRKEAEKRRKEEIKRQKEREREESRRGGFFADLFSSDNDKA